MVEYQTLVDEIRELAGSPDSASADLTAAATVGALGHVLADDNRRRVEAVLPARLRDSMAADGAAASTTEETGFIADIAGRCGCTTEQARLRAQAMLSVLAHHEPEVFASLQPPDWFGRLSPIPLPGSGLTPLTDDEVQCVLDDLPDWTGGAEGLIREVVLPSENVDNLLPAVEAVLRERGQVERTAQGLTITVRPESADAITSYDVDTAHQVDDVLVAASAAIWRPKRSAAGEPIVLFGGRGMAGWRMCGAGAFDLVNSAVQGRGGMGMLWYAEHQFADFLLMLDWRVTHASDIGGVLIRFPEPDDDPWIALASGYEIQMRDTGEGVKRTGAICGIQAPYAEPSVRPPREWHHLEIQARGPAVRVGVNGREVTSFNASRVERGYVGVQNHDNDSRVQYRNIWIFELNE
ncbi:family 16 glycoside hydrolase [Kribbella sancticallisti]|uniref:family 16 glycoside hydrolase n=1 Tax=Kribbella sancticallisti TaxID=460087 RepID=UPI0031DA45AF